MKLEPAVRRASLIVAVGVLICSVIMQLIYLIVVLASPLTWHYSFLLGNLLMGVAVTLNFFLMSVGVQKSVATGNPDGIRHRVQLSYTLRSFLMIGILVIAFIFHRHFHIISTVITVAFPQIAVFASRIFLREEEPVAAPATTDAVSDMSDEDTPPAGGEEADG